MENKNVGYMLLGIAVLLIVIIFMFHATLGSFIETSCGSEHAVTCPMTVSLNQQTMLSLGIVGLLIIIAGVLIFSKPPEKIITEIKEVMVEAPKKEIDVSKLDTHEKMAVELLQKEGGAMFQADLAEKLEQGKVGMTRLLDRLEAKQIVERKRRGMNNIVVLRT